MEIVTRTSCRAILITPENEVLLIKISNPKGNWTGWITPGGGLDANESEIQGLKRELKEELGFQLGTNGTKVWKRFHEYPWNEKVVEQTEVFYFVPTPKFSPNPEAALTESEMLEFRKMRWWSIQDLLRSQEKFAPRDFPKLLLCLLEDGLPEQPFEVGI